jgi:hypothetical protein
MPKFKVLKNGTNEALLRSVKENVSKYLNQMFEASEIMKFDDTFAFSYGTATVNIQVLPWHSEDVLVEVYSYLTEESNLTADEMEELLRLNATVPFGSFGISMEGSIKFSYSLTGKNMDFDEFSSAVQTMAVIADEFDEKVVALASR